MLLRINQTHIVNLRAYKDMRLLGPNQAGLYFVRWSRSGDEALVLEIAKDQAAAQKVFDTIANAWTSGKATLDWPALAQTLYQRVRLPDAWMYTEFFARDLEPRFLVRPADGGMSYGRSAKYLSNRELQDLIGAMQYARSWPPNHDSLWGLHSVDEPDGEPDTAQRTELIRALQAALAS